MDDKERRTLGQISAEAVRELVSQTRRLATAAERALSDSSVPVDELGAALRVMEELSRAGGTIIREEGGVIFPGEPQEPVTEFSDKRPTTFGELLRGQIDQLIPSQQQSFNRREIVELSGLSESGLRKAAKSLGLTGRSLTREQATKVVEKCLLTPRSYFVPRESYGISKIHNFSVPRIHGEEWLRIKEQVEDWSRIIGYDWRTNPTVNLETALQIRGLIILAGLTSQSRV